MQSYRFEANASFYTGRLVASAAVKQRPPHWSLKPSVRRRGVFLELRVRTSGVVAELSVNLVGGDAAEYSR